MLSNIGFWGWSEEVIDLAVELTQRQKLRGCDAIHLATALIANRQLVIHQLPSLIFVAADEDLLLAAHGEGLSTENPNLHP